jgi:serine 3-dehydrogenase
MIDTNITALVTLTHRLLPQLVGAQGRDHQHLVGGRRLPVPGRQCLRRYQGLRQPVSLGLRSTCTAPACA